MSPDQLKIQELEKKVTELELFMNNLKSAATIDPQVPRAIGIRNAVLKKGTVGGTTGMTRSVNESGAGSYTVADVPDGSLILINEATGEQFKVPTYTI